MLLEVSPIDGATNGRTIETLARPRSATGSAMTDRIHQNRPYDEHRQYQPYRIAIIWLIQGSNRDGIKNASQPV
jgi:hypothetical protein